MYRLKEPLLCIPSWPFHTDIRFRLPRLNAWSNTEEKENAVKNKWKDAVEKAVKKDAPLRLEVGKRYRKANGETVTILFDDGRPELQFRGSDGRWYNECGTWPHNREPLVALVEDEPAKPEEPKKNPPLAVGQVWRRRDGKKTTVLSANSRLGTFEVNGEDGMRCHVAPTLMACVLLDRYDLVEYIGEANLDPKAEDVVQSKEIPLSEEATMSSKPQDRHESPQQDDRFTQYLIEECARLRDMLEQKDERIDELSSLLMKTAQESIHKQKIMFESILALQMETERKRAADRESLKKDDINALRELCSSNFDAVFEELSNIKESNIETAGDVAAVGGMLAAMQERPECPAPVPATPTAPQEDSLDKGLKLTNRTLTAAQIIWKIIQFTIAFSLFGGAATCAVMMLK